MPKAHKSPNPLKAFENFRHNSLEVISLNRVKLRQMLAGE